MKILFNLIIISYLIIVGGYSVNAQDLKPGKNKVTYTSKGDTISAHVFLPDTYVNGQKLPGIVISPPVSGIKEQTAGLYAKKLSHKGFITLVFDPRGFGESQGREVLLNPYEYVEDILNSVSFIRTLKEVDPDNIFNVGLCAGASYSAYATAFDSRVKAVALITSYLTSSVDLLKAVGGSTKAIRQHVLPGSATAIQKYFETGENLTIKQVPTTKEEIEKSRPVPIGMRDYYLPGKPGSHPRWKNKLGLAGGHGVLSFDILHWTPWFDAVPVFMAIGSNAVSKKGAIQFYDAINGPKDKLVLEGAGHFQIYWMPKYVDPVVDGTSDFLKKHIQKL